MAYVWLDQNRRIVCDNDTVCYIVISDMTNKRDKNDIYNGMDLFGHSKKSFRNSNFTNQ